MGLFSALFSSDPRKEIEECKKRILNFQKNIEIIKKNTANKTQTHYHKSAAEQIKTKTYQIKKERENIASLKKSIK